MKKSRFFKNSDSDSSDGKMLTDFFAVIFMLKNAIKNGLGYLPLFDFRQR